MAKRLEFPINNYFYKKIARPLRTKKDFLVLLLDTVKLFFVDDHIHENKGSVVIAIDKMSRVFYRIENKYFSIAFPFYLEQIEQEYRIYDNNSDVEIDNKMLSIITRIIHNFDFDEVSVEKIYDDFCRDICEEYEYSIIESAWKVMTRMLAMELGYIRYDMDEEHENGELHPLNHLDVNYSSNCTYKLGLHSKIEIDDLIDILDIKKKCGFIVH
jgi:hypothetical protein